MTLPAKLFFGIGFLLFVLGAFLVWERNDPNRLSFRSYQQSSRSQETSVKPTLLSIPSVNISLPIYEAAIVKGKWQDTKSGVSYLSSSPVPGAIGNSIVYGHNWANLLGNLTKVKPGDEISVSFTSGKIKQFIVKFVTVVTPDETHILNQTSDNRLTIYTCTGWFDSKRLVVTAIAE